MPVKHGTAADGTFSAAGVTAWDADHTVDDNTLVAAKLSASATDVVFGRSTAGAGAGEEIAVTAAGRAILDDADATAQRTTLGLGTLATQSGTFSGTSSGTNTGDQTNISGNAATVTTNANLTGPITSTGNATAIASQTGTGTTFVVSDTPTLTTPVLAGTPNAAGEIGRDSTQLAANYYDNGAVGRVSRVVAAGVGTETFTNSTASDQDFTTAIFTIPANSLFASKRYRVTLELELVTGVSSVTLINYLKLGTTKVVGHSAVDFTNSVTRSVSMVYNICGREAAGAAANVTSMPAGNPFLPAGAANTVNQPVALATNGTLAITPGVTYSGTGSTETIELQSWMVEELN